MALRINPETIITLAAKSAERIAQYIRTTEIQEIESLSSDSHHIFVKCENLQHTGSFKLRGAASKLTKLHDEGYSQAITASTGNHGTACAEMMNELGMDGKIYVPTSISPTKEAKLLGYNAQLVKVEGDSKDVEVKARNASLYADIPFISPYNDPDVISGQATIGLELIDFFKNRKAENSQPITQVFVTVGGGGLITGIGSILKSVYPHVKLIGCQPLNSAVMFQSIKAGRIVDIESDPTLSDGSAGGIEQGSITFDLARQLIDDFVLVSEEEIKEGIRIIHKELDMQIEGAAAVALMGCVKYSQEHELEGNSVVILCGGNIDQGIWESIVLEN